MTAATVDYSAYEESMPEDLHKLNKAMIVFDKKSEVYEDDLLIELLAIRMAIIFYNYKNESYSAFFYMLVDED